MKNIHKINNNIYITSDVEIKEGDWVLGGLGGIDIKKYGRYFAEDWKKIILTTDDQLIADGVQAIDDEFLEWFVKNPSCEEVVVESFCKHGDNCPSKGAYDKQNLCDVGYKIIIPKEEPKSKLTNQKYLDKMKTDGVTEEFLKQETLEEVRKVERTELFNSIFSVVKQIPRKDVDGDAMDAPSCAYEIEQLFYKWQQDKNKYSEEEMKEAFYEGQKELSNNNDFSKLLEQFKKK
jgi:hypothetical protein